MAKTRGRLHELSGGGVVMGNGAYRDSLARNQGVRFHKHLSAIREYVTVVRRLLEMETETCDGEIVKVQDLRLDLGAGTPREAIDVPICIGATGPKMSHLGPDLIGQ